MMKALRYDSCISYQYTIVIIMLTCRRHSHRRQVPLLRYIVPDLKKWELSSLQHVQQYQILLFVLLKYHFDLRQHNHLGSYIKEKYM